MKIIEILNEGLKRKVKVIFPLKELNYELENRLLDIKNKIQINGFRSGKVPVSYLQKKYGISVMEKIIQDIFKNIPEIILQKRNEYLVRNPNINISENEKEISDVLNCKIDFIFMVQYEVLPKISIKELSKINIIRQNFDFEEKELDDKIKDFFIFKSLHEFKDISIFDFISKNDYFKNQKKEKVSNSNLEINDKLAKSVGFSSVFELKKKANEHLQNYYNEITYLNFKLQIFENLEKIYIFEIPKELIISECQNILNNKKNQLSLEEIFPCIEKRMRIGLILASIGKEVNIKVSDEELKTVIYQKVKKFSNSEEEMINIFSKNPSMLKTLYNNIFEKKIIEYLSKKITITEEKVSIHNIEEKHDPYLISNIII